MKKSFFIAVFLSVTISGAAQGKISFSYDAAGNQESRTWCATCTAKMAKVKATNEITTTDLQKFLPTDTFSYYPNPVQQELYLKWEQADGNALTAIKIYTMNGALVRSFDKLEKTDNQTVPFAEYPEGMYILELTNTNGEQKTVKIIKKL